MAMVSETVGQALESARHRIALLERKLTGAEKRVAKGIEEFRGQLEQAPAKLRSAFDWASENLRARVAFASRSELAEIAAKVDELSKRVDGLLKRRAKAS